MTLDELCFATKRSPADLERWAQLGALGDRWKEPRNSGKWRHITKDVAGRAIIMERLVQLGISEERAAPVASHYEKKRAEGTIVSTVRGVRLEINLEELNLP